MVEKRVADPWVESCPTTNFFLLLPSEQNVPFPLRREHGIWPADCVFAPKIARMKMLFEWEKIERWPLYGAVRRWFVLRSSSLPLWRPKIELPFRICVLFIIAADGAKGRCESGADSFLTNFTPSFVTVTVRDDSILWSVELNLFNVDLSGRNSSFSY